MNLNQGYSSGGSINNAQSMSQTMGTAASQRAINTTGNANASAMQAWQEAAKYNAEQARIQREWQERMANTVYQRTVADMKAAGINPVLAAGMGLGTASVSGGSAASISPSQVYNAQTFADSMSASESYGKSWNSSESGLMTFANALVDLGKSLYENMSSSNTIEIVLKGLEDMGDDIKTEGKTITNGVKSGLRHLADDTQYWLYEITNGKIGKQKPNTQGKYSGGGTKF